jgi:3-hydroxybutyryl-CoA dehydrogenase
MSGQVTDKKVAVAGLGLLGRGIAACFLAHGFRVVAIDQDKARLAAARDEIALMIGELITPGGFPESLRAEWEARFLPQTVFAAASDCCFVVESVTESVAVKEVVYDELEGILPADIVIATNTSAIPISELQRRRKVPERFVGMHWAEPAHATRFSELICGEKTSEETLRTAAEMARQLGKEPCVCRKDIPGFIVNRIGYAMYREAFHLIQSGAADAATIDCAMRNALGLWASVCGPMRWIDITGGPELYAKTMQHVVPTLDTSKEVSPVLKKLADAGARGIANGHGFYSYTKEDAEFWEQLYRKHAWRVTKMQQEYFPLNKTMSDRKQKLEALGYPITKRTPEGSLVDPIAIAGNLLYASGQVPFDGEVLISKGKVPSQVSMEEATRAAELCAANVLRSVHGQIGSLEKINRVVRITGYVNADADFLDCHLVINGASRLVREVFGDAGRHARTALSMAQLPLGASVEVEMIFQLES